MQLQISWLSKRLLAVLVALIAAFITVALGATSAAAQTTAQDIDKSVVWVKTTYEGRVDVLFAGNVTKPYEASTTFSCTGWFSSGSGHISTAGHCLQESRDVVLSLYANVIAQNNLQITGKVEDQTWPYKVDKITAQVRQPAVVNGPLSNSDWLVAEVIEQEPFLNGDNALLRVSNLTNTPFLTVASTKPAVGDEVTAIGFPGSVDSVTADTQQPPSHKKGSVSSFSTTDNGSPVTEIDAGVSQGMSGGPTIDAAGNVVGTNSFKLNGESQPFNFITDTEKMRTFLNRNGVDVAAQLRPVPTQSQAQAVPTAPVAMPDSGTPVIVWVLGVLVLALLATVGVLVWKLKPNHKTAPGQQSPQNQETQETQETQPIPRQEPTDQA